jgi:cytochrome c oxidase subunit II
MKRRTLLGFFLGAFLLNSFAQRREAKIIQITARKFEFIPAELTLQAGVPVILELATEDVTMGFDAPGLGLHAEIVPGKVTRVAFTPDKPGTFDYICDIFCGEGHEDMGGVIKVIA